MTHDEILALMRRTGAPLVVSGVRTRKWRFRHHTGRLLVGASPTLKEKPSAYECTIAGRKVPSRVVLAMMKAGKVDMRRPWFVRTRCRPAQAAS